MLLVFSYNCIHMTCSFW